MPLTNVEKYSALEASVRCEMSWRGKWRRDEDVNRLIWTRISAPAALSRVSKDDARWWDYPPVYAETAPSIEARDGGGGGIEASGGEKWDSDLRNQKWVEKWRTIFSCSMSCSDFIHLVLWEWVADDWSEDWLFISLSFLLLAHTFGSGCLYLW